MKQSEFSSYVFHNSSHLTHCRSMPRSLPSPSECHDASSMCVLPRRRLETDNDGQWKQVTRKLRDQDLTTVH